MSALLLVNSRFPAELLGGAVVALTAVVFGILWHRLYLHPLAHFPGPKLAAATWWYMTYYEVFKDGAMVEHLEYLHARYGPVVRIGPNQLHFKDLKAYTDIYSNSNRFMKDPRMYDIFGRPDCIFSIVDIRAAKVRRDYLSPIFSRRVLLKLEPMIQTKTTEQVDALVQHLLRYGEAGKPANIRRGYHSFTTEVIYAYCFASDENYMSAPDFAHKIVRSSETAFNYYFVFVHFPWLYVLLKRTLSLAAWFQPQPPSGPLERLHEKICAFADQPDSLQRETQETLFHHLIAPHTGREGIRSKAVLWQEANNMVAAGSETTASILTIATFYILNDPTICVRLVQELVEAWPDVEMQVSLATLEKLPYLTAIIKESLRIGHGIVAPLPRISVTPTDTVIAGYAVPSGTVVAAGHTFIHLDPTVFPDPHTFKPDRWLEPSKYLEQHLVAFSRGIRQCIGVNLAWCEFYLVLGNVFRKLELKLHDTMIEDMQYRCQLTPTYQGKMPHCTVAPRKGS